MVRFVSKIIVAGEKSISNFVLVPNPSSSFENSLKVLGDGLVGELSMVDSVGVDAVPNTNHEWSLLVIDHEVIFELLQAFRVEKPDGAL
jgi:hypothetical protein